LNIDEPYIRKGTSDEFYETDALGSSLVLTNGAGASQSVYTYQPFGSTTQSGAISSNPFQFTGRENDSTGLYYFRSRYYSPNSRRFTREDPWEFKGYDIDLYAYVANRPANLVDPYGLVLEVPSNPVFQEAFGKLIARSPVGLGMINQLQDSPTHYQVLDATGQKVSVTKYLTVAIDPVWIIQRSTCSGNEQFKFSLERVLAHEMGHLIGYKRRRGETEDAYEMRIIGQYENPVARDLHQPIRTQHIEPPCVQSKSER
jgi:RHS repeat-associated protein